MGGVCTDYVSIPSLGPGSATVMPDGISELQVIANPPTGRFELGNGTGLFRLMGGDYDGVITYADGRIAQIAPDQDAQHPSVVRTSPDGTTPPVYSVTLLSANGQSRITVQNLTEAQRNRLQELRGATIQNNFLLRDTSGLCRLNRGIYAGLVTYDDGRVVQIAPDQDAQHPSVRRTSADGQPAIYSVVIRSAPGGTQTTTLNGISQAQLDLINRMQQTEVGPCTMSGGTYQIQRLPMSAGPWSEAHERGLLGLFSNEPNNVFFCADGSQQGQLGLNTSSGQGFIVRDALERLRSTCSTVLGPNSAAQCAILQNVADSLPPSASRGFWQEYKHEIIGFVALIVGFFILGPWIQRRFGGGGDGHGGGGGNGITDEQAATIAAKAAAQAAAGVLGALGLLPQGQPAGQAADQPAANPDEEDTQVMVRPPQSTARMADGFDVLQDALSLAPAGRVSASPQGVDAINANSLPNLGSPNGSGVRPPIGVGIQVPGFSGAPVVVPVP